MFKRYKTVFSNADEPPLWSDADDSLEYISGPKENEDDIPEDKDLTHEGEGEAEADVIVADVGGGETHGEDEDSSDSFFDAVEGTVIFPGRLSLHAASESGQSGGGGGGTEGDPIGPITPSTAAGPTSAITYNDNKQ